VCTPTHLAAAAQHIAARAPAAFSLEVLEAADCAKLGMGCFLGVAEASSEPAKFIHLTYKPPSGSGSVKKVAVVGKGLTFDSGGYNLKAGAGSMIELMKFDMGGAAAALGAARVLADTQPAGVEAHFIVASCENMVAAKGLRPGDVLTAASGARFGFWWRWGGCWCVLLCVCGCFGVVCAADTNNKTEPKTKTA
jgi:leucyl aminopeptidase